MRTRPLALSAALIALSAGEARALDPDKRVTQLRHESWKRADGMPVNHAGPIAETPDGYLWFGTEVGLVRFDGVRFTVFDSSTVAELESDLVKDLAITADGTLWIGSRGGLLAYRDGSFTSHGADDGIAGVRVDDLLVDRAGRLWVATEAGVFGRDGERFTAIPLPAAQVGKETSELVDAADGALWLIEDPILRWHEGVLAPAPLANPPKSPQSMAVGRDGTLWIGGVPGLIGLRGDDLTEVARPPELAGHDINDLLVDRDGALWISTVDAGVFRLAGGRVEPLAAITQANRFYEDRRGDIWVATNSSGLHRLSDAPVTPLSVEEGLSDRYATALMAEPDGSVWAGTQKGLHHIEGRTMTHYGAEQGLTHEMVLSIFRTRAGALLVGTGGGLFRLDGGTFTRVEGGGDVVIAITETADGALWTGTITGARRLRGGEVTVFGRDHGFSALMVTHLVELDGALWATTLGGGVCRFAGERFECAGADQGATAVLRMVPGEAGSRWLVTYGGGLVRWRDGRFDAVTRKQGLYSDVVFELVPDGAGHFWGATNDGVFRVALADLEAAADGRARSLPALIVGARDGMRSSECNGGFQRAGVLAADGRLWFPTTDGFVVVDPAKVEVAGPPPRVLIEESRAGGAAWSPPRGPLALAPDSGALEIRFTGLDARDPAALEFRHRLVGLHERWIDDGTRRVAVYPSLPPGDYRFEVAARSPGGAWSEPAVLAVARAPRFYQTFWFRAAAAAATALVMIGLYRLRIVRLVARERELAALVDARTADLSAAKQSLEEANRTLEQRVADGIDRLRAAERMAAYGQTVAGVAHEVRQPIFALSTAAYLLGEKLKDRADVEPQIGLLQRETKRMGTIMDELLEFAKPAALFRTRTEVPDLFREAVELFQGEPGSDGVEVAVDVDGAVPALDIDRTRILQVVGNLMRNARKHAQGITRIGLRAEPAAGGALIAVDNDGAGIAAELLPHLFEPFFTTGRGTGLGLPIAKRLVEAHGGTIEVASGDGGTRFSIRLPSDAPSA